MNKTTLLLVLFLTITGAAYAAESVQSSAGETPEKDAAAEEGQQKDAADLLKKLEALTKLKISGYVQAQYVHDERSESEFAGGSSRNRDTFSVRRGRLNVQYQALPTAKLVIQPDFSSSGVALRDAYIELTEPWTEWRHTLVAGQFKWPFGFEVLYSSRDRELPERSLVVRTLFPGERDRGLMLRGRGLQDRAGYWLGVFNGNGTGASQDVDRRKDVVGRVQGSLGPVDAALSAYRGEELVPTSARPAGERFDKERTGLDLQWQTPLPGLALRGEYIDGQERGADVDGWYAYAVQKLGKRHQLAARFDTYDPNRAVDGNAVDTLGMSYVFWWDANSKIMLAYEMPETETSDIDDDVITVRYQFQF